MPAADERRVPVETVTLLAFRRLGAQVALLAGAEINAVDVALLTLRVENVAIRRIENDVKSIAALECGPIGITDAFLARHLARADKTFVVLQAAGDPVKRLRGVERDAVKFARRHAGEMVPGFPRRVTLIKTAIGPEQEALADRWLGRLVLVLGFRRFRRRRRSRLNGERMTIGMHFLGKIFPEIPAAVVGYEQRHAEHVNALIVSRIDPDLAE